MGGYTDSIAERPQNGYIEMWNWLNEILVSCRKCFRREASFKWFVVVVIGLMIGQEHLGITSIVRELYLNPRHYDTMLHLFRSSAWNMGLLGDWWIRIVLQSGLLFLEEGMPILIGDGVKKSKEAKKMPCVKRMHQDSENSSTPSYMFGHMFGAIGVLVGSLGKLFCVPLSLRIHDGDAQIKQWTGSDSTPESHVVRIIHEASQVAARLGKSILLLDRYYLSVPGLTAWIKNEANAGCPLLSLVMRAKGNPAAYGEPIQKPGRGRPRKKGVKIKVGDLFESCRDAFTQAKVTLYGKEETISYLCRDLLWGQKLYQKLRFVLVICGNTKSIFVSTDLTLSPEQIIRLYGYRFKIECCFRELKQVIAGFTYRFWTCAMPKLNRYAKSGTDPLQTVTDEKDKARVLAAFMAVERFVMTACVALGLLQLCALRFAPEINASPLRWLRTHSNGVPSEATTAHFMRKTIFYRSASTSLLPIFQFISDRQSTVSTDIMHSDLEGVA